MKYYHNFFSLHQRTSRPFVFAAAAQDVGEIRSNSGLARSFSRKFCMELWDLGRQMFSSRFVMAFMKYFRSK